jgi:glutathione S-transferase
MRYRDGGNGALALVALTVLTAGLLHPARAEQSASREQIKQTLILIIAPVSITEALAARCDTLSPKSRASRQAALKAWRDANRIDAFEAAIVPIFARIPDSVASISALRDKAAAKAKAETEKTPTICENFDALLREKTFAIGDQIADILPVLAAANARLAAGTPSAPPASGTITLYTIVQLSTAAEAAMNTVASADAAKDRKIRETREKAGKAALEALGVIAVRANVVGSSEVREWRGDQQSTHRVSCRAFVNKQTEERFKGLEGSETTIAGRVTNFVGSSIILAKAISRMARG